MDIKQILKDHKLWLATRGKGGIRADLSEANLFGANLSGADLSGANLSGANLYGADLSGANLYGANLYGAKLSEANLSEANLYGANLYGAKLFGTNIISFQLGKHFGFYHEGNVKIGCKHYSLEYWLKNYKDIGIESNYSEKEIKKYGKMLKLLKELE